MASNCALLTTGRDLPCKSPGGVHSFYLSNQEAAFIPVFDVTNPNIITDLGSITVYEYQIRSATNLAQTMTSSAENGTVVVDQIFNAILHTLDYKTDAELKLFAYSNPYVFAHLNNGDTLLMGINWGCNLDTAVADTGTGIGEFAGYTLTVSAQEIEYAPRLGGSTLGDPFSGMTKLVTVASNTAPGAVPAPDPIP